MIDAGTDDGEAADLLGEVLHGMEFTQTGESDVAFGCTCSKERVMAGLATIDRAEIADMVREGKPLDISCDYCNTRYDVRPAELLALLSTN